MPLPGSGAISLQDIEDEFGGSGSISIDEYQSHVGQTSGDTISFSDFYGLGAADADLTNYTTLSNFRSGTCTAKYLFKNDGNIYESSNTGTYGTSEGSFTSTPGSVWVLADITSGSALDENDFSSRSQPGVNSEVGYATSSTKTGTLRIRVYDAPSLGNLLAEKSVTLSATVF